MIGRYGLWSLAVPLSYFFEEMSAGVRRIEDLDGVSFVDLLRMPNIRRRDATALIDVYADMRRRGR